MRQQLEITTLYFNKGARVRIAATETCPEVPGEIECENSQRPGWYYVRRRDPSHALNGCLLLAQWQDLRLDSEAYDVP